MTRGNLWAVLFDDLNAKKGEKSEIFSTILGSEKKAKFASPRFCSLVIRDVTECQGSVFWSLPCVGVLRWCGTGG